MMAIGIAEVKRANAGRGFVPIRNALRAGGSVLHFKFAQALISLVHVAYDNRNVLKPSVVAAHVHRNRPAFRSEIIHQLDKLLSKPQTRHANSQSEDAE